MSALVWQPKPWWLPVGVLIGRGSGAITTGATTAAMLSVTSARFAAAGGLNQTARQVSGALGLAVLTGGSEGDVRRYAEICLLCAVATLAVAFAARRVVFEERRS